MSNSAHCRWGGGAIGLVRLDEAFVMRAIGLAGCGISEQLATKYYIDSVFAFMKHISSMNESALIILRHYFFISHHRQFYDVYVKYKLYFCYFTIVM